MKRTPLNRGKSLARKTALKATKALERKAPPKRKGPVSQSVRKAPLYSYDEFWRRVCVKDGRRVPCVGCGGRAEDAHHAIPKQRLHQIARSLGMDAPQLGELLMDRRNGVPLCRRCHDLHESHHRVLPLAKLPAEVIQFAAWWDSKLKTEENEAYLERTYS